MVGAILEWLGIMLVGSPDLVPLSKRFSRWGRQKAQAVTRGAERLFRRRKHAHVVGAVSAGGSIAMTGHASVFHSLPADATIEQKVDFLMRRDQQSQTVNDALSRRLEELGAESETGLRGLRAELETLIDKNLGELKREYFLAKLVGVAALVVGLGLTTAGNFV